MKRLAPDLFDRRFGDLMEMARARIPGLAPEWTDHNAHDPGITLMELLAWVTEAQLYSFGRMRRDERAAYGALFGLAPGGTRPARGLIWPDRLDPVSPVAVFSQSRVIARDAVVNMLDADAPTFRPDGKLLFIPGCVRRLAARRANGRVFDYTVLNQRGGSAYQPFESTSGRDDVLLMEFECRGDEGIFPPKRSDAEGAVWPVGVRADVPLTAAASNGGELFAEATSACCTTSLVATLVVDSLRYPIRIASDTTAGLLRTGVLLLDLSAVKGSPKRFTLELGSPSGFERTPRLLRIEPNVLPIVQGQPVPDEVHVSTGIPDWSFQLNVPGLRFAPFARPVKIELRDTNTNGKAEWRQGRLIDSGPNDEVFELDIAADRVTFGNGVNGRIPPAEAHMLATYSVCDGNKGGVAANRKWKLQGFLGSFGVNVDAVGGGAAPTTWIDERREARRRAREDHALVSADDIEKAALDLPLLEVARAWVRHPDDKAPRTGIVTLVAMRARKSEEEAGNTPETRRWLGAIHRSLVRKMPLATRLTVTAPRYAEFSIHATIEVTAGRDPVLVKPDVLRELGNRLALVGPAPRNPGIPVTKRDVNAWIRAVDGVQRVTALRLVLASGEDAGEVKVSRGGLPRFNAVGSALEVVRPGLRAAS